MSDESPERRTLKMMLSRPELVDHMALNNWKHYNGHWHGIQAKAEWDAMPPEERQKWIDFMWERHTVYTAIIYSTHLGASVC